MNSRSDLISKSFLTNLHSCLFLFSSFFLFLFACFQSKQTKTEPVVFGPFGNSLKIVFKVDESRRVTKIKVQSVQEHRDKQTEVEVALPLQQTRTSALGASFLFLRKGCEQEWHSRGFK